MSDQSGCIKITARGSASQGKNDTVFLDKLVVGNTYMLMNLEWARELMAIINSNTSIVHLLRQCTITAELLALGSAGGWISLGQTQPGKVTCQS